MGSAPPVRRFHALRAFPSTTSQPTEADWRPTLRFRAPSEVASSDPRCHRPVRRLASSFRQAANASSPGLLLTLRHIPAWWCCMMAANPFAAADRVRGLITPFATYTTKPFGCRRLSASHTCQRVKHAGAPLGFTLQGVPLDRDRDSSRSPCPLGVSLRVSPPPEGRGCQRKAVFRALISRRVRSDTVATGASSRHHGRRSLPGVAPLQSFYPLELATRLSRGLPSCPPVG